MHLTRVHYTRMRRWRWRWHSLVHWTHSWRSKDRTWIRIKHRLLNIAMALTGVRDGARGIIFSEKGGVWLSCWSSGWSGSAIARRETTGLCLRFNFPITASPCKGTHSNNRLYAVFIECFGLSGYFLQGADCYHSFINNISRSGSRIDKLIRQLKSSTAFGARLTVPETIP